MSGKDKITKSKKGGTKKSKNIDDNKLEFIGGWDSHAYSKNILTVEEYNKQTKDELIEKYKWDKPFKYDEEGKIKWPNIQEFTKHNIDRKFIKMDDWMKEYNSMPESIKIKRNEKIEINKN
jgi:hypothetical protein